jgi:hypothetical protein
MGREDGISFPSTLKIVFRFTKNFKISSKETEKIYSSP